MAYVKIFNISAVSNDFRIFSSELSCYQGNFRGQTTSDSIFLKKDLTDIKKKLKTLFEADLSLANASIISVFLHHLTRIIPL